MSAAPRAPARPLVMKFGGTSVADAERISAAARIVAERVAAESELASVVVVVSALSGVTDALERVLAEAVDGDDWIAGLDELARRHRFVADSLAPGEEARGLEASSKMVFAELRSVLHGVQLLGEATARTRDAVIGSGEQLSAPIFAAACRALGVAAEYADAREFIVTDHRFGRAGLKRTVTHERTRRFLGDRAGVTVIPGFVAATEDGHPTTLGRGGSDFSAAIVGAALGAPEIEIWSDVDGVMSADPARVSEARSLDEVGYDEIIELAHFGARVVFEPTIHEAREAGAVVVIRNTSNPAFPGTRLLEEATTHSSEIPVCGITSLSNVALIRVGGRAIRGEGRARERLLRAIEIAGSPSPLLVQIGSGQGVSLAVQCTECSEFTDAIETEFELEIAAGRVEPPVLHEGLALLAVVGTALESRPGVSGRIFAALGAEGINVHAIAQGTSGRSVAFFVDSAAEARSLQVVHSALFQAKAASRPGPVVRKHQTEPARVYLAGVGTVGGELLRQIARLPVAEGRTPSGRPALEVAGIASSTRVLLAPEPGDSVDARLFSAGSRLAETGAAASDGAEALVRAALADPSSTRIFVDCTPNVDVAWRYRTLLDRGVAVVSANKSGFSSNGELWADIRSALDAKQPLYFETTVGAGLPVLRTVSELVATGDRVRRIEGVLSGTLSYLLGALHRGGRASEVLRRAHEQGLTEPDPRLDLSGRDVARKAVILGRIAGFDPDPHFEPDALFGSISADAGDSFWERLALVDETVAEQARTAEAEGRRLSYIAGITPDDLSVGLEEIPTDHPCALGEPGTNAVSVWSDRYDDAPLTIQGFGAGPGVTAQGVLADILRAVALSNGR